MVVDTVTTRRADLHAAILEALGASEVTAGPAGPSATAYRAAAVDSGAELHAWLAPLLVGEVLPTVPLWIAPDLAVPLDLEASHAAACEDIRVRPAG